MATGCLMAKQGLYYSHRGVVLWPHRGCIISTQWLYYSHTGSALWTHRGCIMITGARMQLSVEVLAWNGLQESSENCKGETCRGGQNQGPID